MSRTITTDYIEHEVPFVPAAELAAAAPRLTQEEAAAVGAALYLLLPALHSDQSVWRERGRIDSVSQRE